eukprot:4386396-Pleurochrysis_carterae.AAC.1
MPAVNMFSPRVVLWVVGEVDCRLIVQVQRGSLSNILAQFLEERAQVRRFFRGLRCSDNFGFAGRQRHGWLLLAAPGDCRASVHEHMPRGEVTGSPVGI